MQEAAIIFFGQLLAVFLLGFQSRLVNRGHKAASFCTSTMIGLCQLYMFKLVPAAHGLGELAFLMAGPIGIVLSIVAHEKLYKK